MTSPPAIRALSIVLPLIACETPPPPPALAAQDPAPAKSEAAPLTSVTGSRPELVTGSRPESSTGSRPELAQVRDDVPLPLTSFLGQEIAAAEAKLDPPLGKGISSTSCVRFVPERVFFACKHALQRYGDKTGTFAALRLEVEDGVITGVGYEGWKAGQGPVTPAPLLAAIGLELPEAPRSDSPDPQVRRWSWFNNLARLMLAGQQYRVEMSVVGDEWARSRLDVILNHPLTPAQKAAILPVKAP